MEIVLKYFSEFTETQLQQLQSLRGLYQDWNEKINVISRKDIDSLYEKHVLHSLAIAAAFSFDDGAQIVDLGCGGGFLAFHWPCSFPGCTFIWLTALPKTESCRRRSRSDRLNQRYGSTLPH
ncbi:class I SAM-dependent methyltransferase [Niabella defluvii]|nr:class I SAM-dependent methyltransferase [Niabella sp. I65]